MRLTNCITVDVPDVTEKETHTNAKMREIYKSDNSLNIKLPETRMFYLTG